MSSHQYTQSLEITENLEVVAGYTFRLDPIFDLTFNPIKIGIITEKLGKFIFEITVPTLSFKKSYNSLEQAKNNLPKDLKGMWFCSAVERATAISENKSPYYYDNKHQK